MRLFVIARPGDGTFSWPLRPGIRFDLYSGQAGDLRVSRPAARSPPPPGRHSLWASDRCRVAARISARNLV